MHGRNGGSGETGLREPRSAPTHSWPGLRKEALRQAQVALGNQLERLTEAYLMEVIPLAEYQRCRQELEHKQHALTIQEKQLEAQVDRQGEFASMVTSIEAFCQRVRAGLADATFEQKRALVELLIDRVLVDNGKVEIRYVIPRAPRGETTHFYQLRKDYFEMPLVAGPWPASTYLVGIILPELATPFTDCFIGDPDATCE